MSVYGKCEVVKTKDGGVQALADALRKAHSVATDVGIFSSNNDRWDSSKSNASIGARHEFGDSEVYERSFLRVPLSTNLGKHLNRANLTQIASLITLGEPDKAAMVLGEAGERTVRNAFDTSGDGTWPPTAERYAEIKGHNLPLIDTMQLRDSITSRVAE